MAIGPGTRIGAYEVVSPLGAGGMGVGATQPPSYDVTADGRFVMVQWTDAQALSLKVVVNAISPRASAER